ncbi:MAG: retron system putative HNH endonuclease [Janthinobacterium lividum]
MKKISKLLEPKLLTEYRANQPAFYDGLTIQAKEDLRKNLLLEQGFICCYCLKRIPETVIKDDVTSKEMKIEHYQSQDKFPLLQLTYSNLFGACTGNEGNPQKIQTCDTRKGKDILTINLLISTPNCETLFKYNADGEISSIDKNEEIDRQLNAVLNLNMQTLKENRRQVFLEVQRRVENESSKIKTGNLKLKYFEEERKDWLRKNDNKYKPFCMVAIYYLTKKIKQYQK